MSEQAVYLLPGLLCDASVWVNQKRDLADISDVLIADFYGFDSLTKMAESVLENAPDTFSVVGHSMGARVALEVIRLAPARVCKIALLDTGTHALRPGEAEKRGELVDLARKQGMKALADAWLPPMVHPDKLHDAVFMQSLVNMVCRATSEIFASQIKGLINRPEAVLGLSAITCPTLVACGRQDVWSPLSQHEEIAGHIPHSKLVVFENSGHMSICETPDVVTTALRNWLTQ